MMWILLLISIVSIPPSLILFLYLNQLYYKVQTLVFTHFQQSFSYFLIFVLLVLFSLIIILISRKEKKVFILTSFSLLLLFSFILLWSPRLLHSYRSSTIITLYSNTKFYSDLSIL